MMTPVSQKESKTVFIEPQLTPQGSWSELTGGSTYQTSGYNVSVQKQEP